mgnify:CR=1 FL=1
MFDFDRVIDRRDTHASKWDMMAKLSAKGVGSTIYYPVAPHRQECFASAGQGEGSCPVSEKLTRTVFSLPMYPELTDTQVNEAADAVLS